MATVRISGNLHSQHQTEWVGAPAVGPDGRIDRSVPLPNEAYEAIEAPDRRGSGGGRRRSRRRAKLQLVPGRPHPARRRPDAAGGEPAQGFDRLHVLLPDIDRIARGELDGSERQTDVIRLLAYVVADLLRSSEDAAKP